MPDGGLVNLGKRSLEPKDLLARADYAFKSSANFRQTWDQARLRFLPEAAPFFQTNMTQGARDRAVTLDTYGQYANRVYATFLFGAIVSNDNEWVKITAHRNGVSVEDPEIVNWTDEYRRALLRDLLDEETGFTEQLFASLLQYGAYRNSRLYVGDRPGALPIVRCTDMRDSAWEAGTGHLPGAHWWRQTLTAAEWYAKFPQAILGEKVTKAATTEGSRNQTFAFIHGTIENPDWNPTQEMQVPTKRRHLSIWLNEADTCLVSQRWLQVDRYAAIRAPRRAQEQYGRGGAGDEALEEVEMAQRVRMGTIRGYEKSIDPTLLLPDDGLLTPPTNESEGAMVLRADLLRGAGDPVRFLKSTAAPEKGLEFLTNSVYAAIDRAFAKDVMTLPRESRMLDAQIVGVQEEQARAIVPLVSPLYAPIGRTIAIFAHLRQRDGKLPKAPPSAHGIQLDIEFRNPIDKAARLAEVRAFMQVLSIAVNASQVDPLAAHALKVVEGVQHCARVMGVPAKLIASAQELKAASDAMAKASADKARLEAAKDGSTVAKNLGAGGAGLAAIKSALETGAAP